MQPSANPYVAAETGELPAPRPTPGNWIAAVASVALALGLLAGIVVYQRVRDARPVAEAIVQIARQPTTTLPPRVPMDEDSYERFRITQSNLIPSDHVLGAALRRPSVSSLSTVRRQLDPIRWLSEALIVEAPDNSELLVVRLDSADVDDADQAVAIINAVVSEYVDYANSQEQMRRTRQVDRLRISVGEFADTLQQRRREHHEIKQGAGETSADTESLASRIEGQQRILDELQLELARAEIELEASPRVDLVQEARSPEQP